MPVPEEPLAVPERFARLLAEEGTIAMAQASVGSTDPELLRRIAVLRDDPAWSEFFRLYAPLVTAWCTAHGFDPESTDELCQRVWVELVQRMPSYQYDPGGSFRGWLRWLCRHRAVNMFRERRDYPFENIGSTDLVDERWTASSNTISSIESDEMPAGRLRLLSVGQEVQEAVKRKVKPVRWEVFWRVRIEGESISRSGRRPRLEIHHCIRRTKSCGPTASSGRREATVRLGLDTPANPQKGR